MKRVITLLLVLLLAVVSTSLLYADNNLSKPNREDLHLQEIQKKVDSIQGTVRDKDLVSEQQATNGDGLDEIDAKRGPEIHECHSGSAHRKCEKSVLELDCGCKSTRYDCCCGRRMAVKEEYCKDHDSLGGLR